MLGKLGDFGQMWSSSKFDIRKNRNNRLYLGLNTATGWIKGKTKGTRLGGKAERARQARSIQADDVFCYRILKLVC